MTGAVVTVSGFVVVVVDDDVVVVAAVVAVVGASVGFDPLGPAAAVPPPLPLQAAVTTATPASTAHSPFGRRTTPRRVPDRDFGFTRPPSPLRGVATV
jgi:hypothetical protein